MKINVILRLGIFLSFFSQKLEASIKSIFPDKLYRDYLASLENDKSLNFTELHDQLVACIDEDTRCSLVLGFLYFQGHVKPKSRHIGRALALWRHAATAGNAEAQFQLALVYATYFNPPALFSEVTPTKSSEKLERFEDRMQSVFNSVNNDELDLFYLSLEVLDLGSDIDSLTREKYMVDSWFLQQASQRNDKVVSAGGQLLLYRRESLALLYLYAAAQQRFVPAQLALGFRHLHGLGVPKRCASAAAYYIQAARTVAEFSTQGIPTASEIIRLSLNGLGITNEVKYSGASTSMRRHFSKLQMHVAESGDPAMQLAVAKKYIFGTDGFPQNFAKAADYLTLAAKRDHRDALSYIGYLSVLGLGFKRDLRAAYQIFRHGATSPYDALAHNGLAYIYFHGTKYVTADLAKAVTHFNISASLGFPDAQYNLAALYLSGKGVPQSYTQAFALLTKALEQGHTTAGYLLGMIYLNGLGTEKDCSLAASLFKRVSEKHVKVIDQLRKALILQNVGRFNEAAFEYWSLAEMGHEVSQSNLAYLLDGGGRKPVIHDGSLDTGFFGRIRRSVSYVPLLRGVLFQPSTLFSTDGHSSIGINRAFAQRYWDLAALQNSCEARTRLGDYALRGWGVELAAMAEYENFLFDSKGAVMLGWANSLPPSAIYVRRQQANEAEAYTLYERSINSPFPPKWTLNHRIKAEHQLAIMHQYGMSVEEDLHIARRRLNRMIDIPGIPIMPTRLSIWMCRLHAVALYISKRSCRDVIMNHTRLLLICLNTLIVGAFMFVRRSMISQN